MLLIAGPQPYSPFDSAVVVLVSLHLLFSAAAAVFVLHFHLRSSSSSSSSPSPSLRRRLGLLLRLNSLWPVRLLLVLFASVLSSSELLRIHRRHPFLCHAYLLASQSFAEPAFFAALLFLLRASTCSKQSPSNTFLSAFLASISASLPLMTLQLLYFSYGARFASALRLPPKYFLAPPRAHHHRCAQPLPSTAMLALFGVVYVPLFISACWGAVTAVINKRLRVRLYVLAAAVVAALSLQVSALALSALWTPACALSRGLSLAAFAAMLACVAVGEGILVVKPVVDALAVVGTEQGPCAPRGRDGDGV